jgi:hypothetical protein
MEVNMDFELANDGVAQPGDPQKKFRKTKYPFGDIGVGQMYLFECKPEAKVKAMHRLSSAANAWCHRNGLEINRFVVRTLPNGVGVYRIGGDDKPLEG